MEMAKDLINLLEFEQVCKKTKKRRKTMKRRLREKTINITDSMERQGVLILFWNIFLFTPYY